MGIASKLSLILFYVLSIISLNAQDSISRISVEGVGTTIEEVLSQYIQHKSLSRNEKNAGDWLKGVCVENGLHISEFGNENGNYNFAASLFPLSDSLPNIILLNHIDVVHEGDTDIWIHPPYSGHISETDVWGRGAFDNKGAAVMQLFSLLEFKSIHSNSNSSYNITFLAVSCEETLCDGGIKYVLNNYMDDLNPVVVIGEGSTELNSILESKSDSQAFGISVAHKRPLWLELELNIPTSGHSSVTPMEYANKEMTIALANLVEKKQKIIFNRENKAILKRLGEQQRGLKRFLLKHPVFFKPIIASNLRKEPELLALFTNTITITSLNSINSTINKIPQSVYATLDCRLLPEYSQERFLNSLRRTLKNEQIQIEIIKEMNSTPVSCSDNDFYYNMEAAIQAKYIDAAVFPVILPNYSDVGEFRSRGIEGFSIIPIALDLEYLKCIHAENERIPIQALYQGTKVYLQFLENSCF